MIRRAGTIVGLAGSAGGLAGSLWRVLLPTPDANIGAGALVVMGSVLCVGGAVLVGIRLLTDALRPAPL